MGLLGAIPVGLGSIVGFRKLRRHRRRRCPACQARMVCLAEADDDALLEEGQQAEERVGSVDYDVWKCEACSHHFTLRYPKWFSGFASALSATIARSHPLRRSSSRRAPPAAAARASSSSARSAASAGSTRRSFRASRRAPRRRAVRRAPAVSAAAARAAAEPVEDIRLARSMHRPEGWPHRTPGRLAPRSRAD